jgi:alpha-glucosidase
MKQLLTTIALFMAAACLSAAPHHYKIESPDGNLSINISNDGQITYSVTLNGKELISPSAISMTLEDGTSYGKNSKVKKVLKRTGDEILNPIAYKKDEIRNNYNELTLVFKTFDLKFRAYDEGAAYRFISKSAKPFTVTSEQAEFSFPGNWNAYVPYANTSDFSSFDKQYMISFENYYSHFPLSKWNGRRLSFLPLVIEAPEGIKICITESDLLDYPGMFMSNEDESTTLKGVFAPYPAKEEQGGHNMLEGLIPSRENFIAKACAGASFPWRVIMTVPQAKDLTNMDLVYKLASPATKEDWSWVKPGKVAWDWWNDWNIYGVDFKSGINNETYEYYIDFASKHHIEYVILDEGWAVNKKADLFQVVPEIDLKELVDYANSKNVGLILWAGYWAFNRDMENVCRHYSQLGIKGFKVDFMNRDDQKMVEFYRKAAATAAKYHLLMDFHGAFKPAGLTRTYPNVLNFEGVAGLEQMKWGKKDQVTYDVTIPFIRMAAGPMDYTQGAMRNAIKANYRPVYSEPMSQGTRCHQLAEYVIFDAPLTMLCDSPSNYMKEPECTDFIAAIPTTWAKTLPLDGQISQYVVMAKQAGDGSWYVGALNNWDERDININMDFLGNNQYDIISFKDGVNADKVAHDFVKVTEKIPADKSIKIHMAPGGGWAAHLVLR